jgi:putative LysE/RhtB family amino acid efflux pump
MSFLLSLIQAIVIGFAIAAPVGPIGMLCIRKTLERGMLGTVAVGIGAALADSLYGIIAATGLGTISHFLLGHSNIIKFIGGAFLIYLAYREISVAPVSKDLTIKSNKDLLPLIWEVFFLTLTNPMTILSFVGIFASIGGGSDSISNSFAIVLGIFIGSMLWWLILGWAITKIKHKLPEAWLHKIRYLSAFIIGIFGIIAILGCL